MNLVTAVLALLLTLSVPSVPPPHSSLYQQVDDMTHVIYMQTITGSNSKCSATAVGPHALLTASHCELPTDRMIVDYMRDVHILQLTRDGYDHTIYFVDITFDTYAKVDTSLPSLGEEVFMFGNPDKYEDLMRKGYVSAVKIPRDFLGGKIKNSPVLIVYDMNSFHGDSGAGIFNQEGILIGVVSQAVPLADKDADIYAKFTYAMSLNFTTPVLQDAAQFHAGDLHNDFTQGR